MITSYCPICRKNHGFQRRLGWGTFFACILTFGFWIFVLPLYPKRCIVCGHRYSLNIPPSVVYDDDTDDTPFVPVERALKKCPSCAEQIRLEALVCRFCGDRFTAEQVSRAMNEHVAKLPAPISGKQLCPDGNCIGVIGVDGNCKECGKPSTWVAPPPEPVASRAVPANRISRPIWVLILAAVGACVAFALVQRSAVP